MGFSGQSLGVIPPPFTPCVFPGCPVMGGAEILSFVPGQPQKREAGCAFLLEQLAGGHSTSLWQGGQPSSAAMRPDWAALPWFVLEPPCGRHLLCCTPKISNYVSLFPCLQALKLKKGTSLRCHPCPVNILIVLDSTNLFTSSEL